MAVGVQRQRHAAVAEPLARDLRVYALRQQGRGVPVPEIVEANAGQIGAGDEPVPCMTNAIRLDRGAILPSANEHIVDEADTKPQQLLGLPQPPRPKLGNRDERQC